MAEPLDPSRHYLDARGEAYARRFGAASSLGRQLQARYFLPYCRDGQVLVDYGCGDGTMLRVLPAARRIGIEVNPACRKIIEAENSENSFIEVLASADMLEDSLADVVISNHCLEHTLNPFATLREISRLLTSGGRVVVVTPFDDWRQRKNVRWCPGDADNHLFTWSPLNLGNLLTEADFAVETVELSSTAWSPRLFWIHRRLGEAAFSVACRALSRLLQRREVVAVARKPDAGGPGRSDGRTTVTAKAAAAR